MSDTTGKLQYRLKGFSGSTVEVRRLGTETLVRKTALSPDLNRKLLNEVEKLTELAQIADTSALFSVPSVLRSGKNTDGKAFYDIEFVPCWQLDFQIPQLNSGQFDRIASRLCEIIEIFSARPIGPQNTSITETQNLASEVAYIRGKFEEALVTFNAAESNCDQVHSLVAEYSDRVRDLDIPRHCVIGVQTFCHGDMALDNVLIGRDDRLYLIDPLVNEHESFMWDISKVFQSSYAVWREIKNQEFRIDQALNKIVLRSSTRISLFNKHFIRFVTTKAHPGAVTLYLAATLARTAKYWRTCDQLCALLMMTNELLDRLFRRRYDLNEPLSSLRW